MLTRRQLLRSSVAITGLFWLSGCRHTVEIGSPMLTFHQGETGCGTGDTGAQIQGAKGLIRFSGAMTTPDPCHTLSAMLESSDRTLIVRLTAVPPKPDVFCVKCIGRASYSGQIINLRPGQYTVKIRHGDREIKQATVTVS